MDPFPFSHFFSKLKTSGISTTVREYQKVSLVLRTQSQWDLMQLRLSLAGILTKSPEQQQIFYIEFDRFFDDTLATCKFTSHNLLQDLEHSFLHHRHVSLQPVAASEPTKSKSTSKGSTTSFWQRLHGILGTSLSTRIVSIITNFLFFLILLSYLVVLYHHANLPSNKDNNATINNNNTTSNNNNSNSIDTPKQKPEFSKNQLYYFGTNSSKPRTQSITLTWRGTAKSKLRPLEDILTITGSTYTSSSGLTSYSITEKNIVTFSLNNLDGSSKILPLTPGQKYKLTLTFHPERDTPSHIGYDGIPKIKPGYYKITLKLLHGFQFVLNNSRVVNKLTINASFINTIHTTKLMTKKKSPRLVKNHPFFSNPHSTVTIDSFKERNTDYHAVEYWHWHRILWLMLWLGGVPLIFLLSLYFHHWYRYRFLSYVPDGPKIVSYNKRFSMKEIGGTLKPSLDWEVLKKLGEEVSTFLSAQKSHTIELSNSVLQTASNGGIPKVCYESRKQNYRVLILEDILTEYPEWNTVATELATGLQTQAIPITFGRFKYNPKTFTTLDGRKHQLMDWEGRKHELWLFIFSDCKRLKLNPSNDILGNLSTWPFVAWFDYRMKSMWKQNAPGPHSFNIPVYPATSDCLLEVTQQFSVEYKQPQVHRSYSFPTSNSTIYNASEPLVFLEQFFGSALPWVQACSLVQPIRLPLAEDLRIAFFPNTPRSYLSLLSEIPGTQIDVAGLRFSTEVLRALRTSMFATIPEPQQEAYLHFFCEQLVELKPKDKTSIAFYTWKWKLARLHLEISPDEALEDLAILYKTSLRGAIKAELSFYSLPDSSEKIPLRKKPLTSRGMSLLSLFLDDVHPPTPNLKLYITGHIIWVTIMLWIVTSSSNLLAESLDITSHLDPNSLVLLQSTSLEVSRKQIEVSPAINSQITTLSKAKNEIIGNVKDYDFHSFVLFRKYDEQPTRLRIFNIESRPSLEKNSGCSSRESIWWKAQYGHHLSINLRSSRLSINCKRELLEQLVSAYHCPSRRFTDKKEYIRLKTFWQTFKKPQQSYSLPAMSAGIEFSQPGENKSLGPLYDTLLRNRVVDVIYRVRVKSGQKQSLQRAISAIEKDLSVWSRYSQVLWWSYGTNIGLDPTRVPFRKVISLMNATPKQLEGFLFHEKTKRKRIIKSILKNWSNLPPSTKPKQKVKP